MEKGLTFYYDREADILYINKVRPYVEQESDELGDEIVARFNPKTGEIVDINLGYASYAKMKNGESISDYYSRTSGLAKKVVKDEAKIDIPFLPEETAFKAKVMLAILVIAALFWATGAIPIGITALLVGVIMYFTGVLAPDDIAQAYAKDAVIFISDSRMLFCSFTVSI